MMSLGSSRGLAASRVRAASSPATLHWLGAARPERPNGRRGFLLCVLHSWHAESGKPQNAHAWFQSDHLAERWGVRPAKGPDRKTDAVVRKVSLWRNGAWHAMSVKNIVGRTSAFNDEADVRKHGAAIAKAGATMIHFGNLGEEGEAALRMFAAEYERKFPGYDRIDGPNCHTFARRALIHLFDKTYIEADDASAVEVLRNAKEPMSGEFLVHLVRACGFRTRGDRGAPELPIAIEELMGKKQDVAQVDPAPGVLD
jgi:hypothetical protein